MSTTVSRARHRKDFELGLCHAKIGRQLYRTQAVVWHTCLVHGRWTTNGRGAREDIEGGPIYLTLSMLSGGLSWHISQPITSPAVDVSTRISLFHIKSETHRWLDFVSFSQTLDVSHRCAHCTVLSQHNHGQSSRIV